MKDFLKNSFEIVQFERNYRQASFAWKLSSTFNIIQARSPHKDISRFPYFQTAKCRSKYSCNTCKIPTIPRYILKGRIFNKNMNQILQIPTYLVLLHLLMSNILIKQEWTVVHDSFAKSIFTIRAFIYPDSQNFFLSEKIRKPLQNSYL